MSRLITQTNSPIATVALALCLSAAGCMYGGSSGGGSSDTGDVDAGGWGYDSGSYDTQQDVGYSEQQADEDVSNNEDDDDVVVPSLTGAASLSFKPTYGPGNQQFDPSLRPLLDFYDPYDVVVFMLCDESDAQCERPLIIRELSEGETDGAPIQGSFGPAITATDLPAGTFNLMVFADSLASRDNGFGWYDDFETSENQWGGHVSEGDVMMSDANTPPAHEFNPPAASIQVTLSDDTVTDLGVILLGHFHERDLTPVRPAENGDLVVAVSEGLQLIDLSTFSLREPNPGFYTYHLTDSNDEVIDGSVCGLVDAGESVVYVLIETANGGVAVPFDVSQRTQLYDGHHVTFTTGDHPCRGTFVDTGSQQFLFVTNATANPLQNAGEGIWYAEVTDLSSTDVPAGFMDENDDRILSLGVDGFAYHDGVLWLTITADPNRTIAPLECRGRHCVYPASIDSNGALDLDIEERLVGPALFEGYQTPNGTIECWDRYFEVGAAGMSIAPFHDGRTLLFLGSCSEIAVFDLATRVELDGNPSVPGVQGIDGTLFGHGFAEFTLSSDGRTLWALPQAESQFDFYLPLDGRRTENDRLMALPIDLTGGEVPGVATDYTSGDVDGYEGDVGGYQTPAIDPGIDLRHAWYSRYQLAWAPDSAGSRFTTSSVFTGGTLAVAEHTLWVRGSGNDVAGATGLGKGGNITVIDLTTGRTIMFTHEPDDSFHEFWLNLNLPSYYFGFDLTPTTDQTVSTFGILYVPTEL